MRCAFNPRNEPRRNQKRRSCTVAERIGGIGGVHLTPGNAAWDKQIEEDSASGKLDFLFDERRTRQT